MNGGAEKPGKEAPNKIRQGYQKIQDLISCGEREKAKAALEEFLLSFPDHSAAHGDLGVFSFQKDTKGKPATISSDPPRRAPRTGTP
jgi:hypothetical protein